MIWSNLFFSIFGSRLLAREQIVAPPSFFHFFFRFWKRPRRKFSSRVPASQAYLLDGIEIDRFTLRTLASALDLKMIFSLQPTFASDRAPVLFTFGTILNSSGPSVTPGDDSSGYSSPESELHPGAGVSKRRLLPFSLETRQAENLHIF